MCDFCNFEEWNGEIQYAGKSFPLEKNIDGTKQNFEIYIFDSPEDEGTVLTVNGNCTELRININYCPICGKHL